MDCLQRKCKRSVFTKSFLLRMIILFSLLFFCGEKSGFCLGWTDEVIRHLPDASFASVETDKSGKRIRRCPYRDAEGRTDYEQMIYVIGTFAEESWIDPVQKEAARKLLMINYEQYKQEAMKTGLQEPLNINTASLTRLVLLPGIGPVLAVKIVRYREENGPFAKAEDIVKVEGIGQGTFNGIRFYIRTE
ncbi:MAG: ComEA family DNA-binding protein [Desulfococcaceae bacterium]